MTSEIVTRAEKAIRANRHNTTEVQAREAIRAIREPTKEMTRAVYAGMHPEDDPPQPYEIWQAMIDEALRR